MENRCPSCEFEIMPNDMFCGSCGFKLSEPKNVPAMTQVEMKLSDIRLNLGIVYFKKGDYGKAIETFQKILNDKPDNAEAMEMLEQAQHMLKDVTTPK